MMEMRRLDPGRDESLVREAVGWVEHQPLFFRNCNAVWGEEDADTYLQSMREDAQADFGVFDSGEFIAVVTVSLEGKDVYNSHLMAKRGANPETIAVAVKNVLQQMVGLGMKEGWMWLAEKNHGVRKILEAVGLKRDGVSRIKGQSHGQPITWCRYSVRVV